MGRPCVLDHEEEVVYNSHSRYNPPGFVSYGNKSLENIEDKNKIGRTMKAAHNAAVDFGGREIVKAGELITASFAKGSAPSLAARKVLALLIGKAAGNAWKPGSHTITKRELRGSHESNDRIPAILDELMGIQFKLETISERGRHAILTAAIIAWNIEETAEDEGAIVEWEFTEPCRRVLQGSDYYARMNRAALLNFDSKYAVTLYELGALLSGRREPRWHGTIAEFREKIGVEPGKLLRWPDLHRFTLQQAQREIDQLAHFTLTWKEKRQGRKVTEIELWFWPKDAAGVNAAADELNRPRVGRKVRRAGTVERITEDRARIAAELQAPLPRRKETGETTK